MTQCWGAKNELAGARTEREHLLLPGIDGAISAGSCARRSISAPRDTGRCAEACGAHHLRIRLARGDRFAPFASVIGFHLDGLRHGVTHRTKAAGRLIVYVTPAPSAAATSRSRAPVSGSSSTK